MSFFHRNIFHRKIENIQKNIQIINRKTSLRAYQHNNSLKKENEKKMSWSTLYQGSMTVEAALIMPIFLFAILNMLSIADIIRVHTNLQAAMTETVKEMAVYGYAYDKFTDGEEKNLVCSLVGKEIAKAKVKELAGTTYLDASMIKDGSDGIWFIRSDVMYQEDMIDLVARYRVTPYFQIAAWNDIFMINRCRMHAWTGYDNVHKKQTQNQAEEQIVYVAEYGEVYHTVRSCSHLTLSIKPIAKDSVSNQRNDYDEKYSPCEKCGKKGTADIYYITNQGNRYHTTLSCSGLKRTIREVPISQAGGLPPCSKCG